MPCMETTTTSPTVLGYDPSAPHHHYLAACRAVYALYPNVSGEETSRIVALIGNAVRESFIRGMDPSRPMA